MTDDTKATIEILETYWQPGGFYKNIPVEIMNMVTGELEEKDKEIEKLNTIIYGIRDRLKRITESYRPNMSGVYFTVKEFAYDDLDKILNELNIENKSIFDYTYKLEEENKRLNNIINELEEHFVFLKINSTGGNKEFFEDILDFIKALQELKGSNKSEKD